MLLYWWISQDGSRCITHCHCTEGEKHMTRHPGKLGSKKSIVSIGLTGTLLVVGVWGVLGGTFRGANADDASQASTSGIALTAPVSPLLFGTNLGLFNTND